MSSEIIKRVAKAIDAMPEPNWGNIQSIMPGVHTYVQDPTEASLARARAAIAAMREPTDEMIEAGYETSCIDAGPISARGADGAAAYIWQAMVDAALADPEESVESVLALGDKIIAAGKKALGGDDKDLREIHADLGARTAAELKEKGLA